MHLDSLNGLQQKHINYQYINPLSRRITTGTAAALHSYSLLEEKFHEITVTYGFASFAVLNYIKKNGPGDMSPE
jgi:hypothetical protein